MKSKFKLLSIFIFLLLISSCSTTPAKMYVSDVKNYSSIHDSVNVNVIGGKEGRLDASSYQSALVDALVKSGLVDSIGNSTLNLNVQILSLNEPLFGGAFTVTIRSLWILKSKDCQEALRKQISSEYTAKLSDNLLGAARLNMASEGAVRENIKDGLEFISTEGKIWKEQKCN
jgi:hypothetical protein